MAEALQPAIGVDRQFAVAVEGAGQHLLPGRAPFGESQVLHQDELGRREAVVHLGHGQLAPGIGDAGLGVGVLGGPGALGKPGVVVVGVDEARTAARREGQRLDVEGLVRVAVGVLGSDHDGGGGAVGHPGAVEHPEPSGHPG